MNKGDLKINWAGEELVLSPLKVMYLPAFKTLVIADVHIGKAAHFRKSGIPVPGQILKKDIENIFHAVKLYDPEELIFLGDLFHSAANIETIQFFDVLKTLPVTITLLIGNHDFKLVKDIASDTQVKLSYEKQLGNIRFTHQPPDSDKENNFYIGGHLHPAVTILFKSRQTVFLPCFYFTKYTGILPAFGHFTGKHYITPKPGDQIFPFTTESVFQF